MVNTNAKPYGDTLAFLFPGVAHLLEARLGGCAADAHGDVRAGEALLHELQHPRPRGSNLRHEALVEYRLLVLQRIDEPAPCLVRLRDGPGAGV